MRCPFCGAIFHNAIGKALKGFQIPEGLVITNIDYIIEAGRLLRCVIEEKHSAKHFVPTYQLVTLKKVARRLNVPLLVTFVDDEIDEITVYDVPLNSKFPSAKFYNFERLDPVFVGGYDEFKDFIVGNFILEVMR